MHFQIHIIYTYREELTRRDEMNYFEEELCRQCELRRCIFPLSTCARVLVPREENPFLEKATDPVIFTGY